MKSKSIYIFALFVLFACNKQKSNENINDKNLVQDTVLIKQTEKNEKEKVKEFSNERFRKVAVVKLEGDKFRVQGEAQVFEATINWSVEDGHYVYNEGFTTATMGAPEWGKFDFTFEIKKLEEIAVLNLVLYEVSAEDGSHIHTLLVPLK